MSKKLRMNPKVLAAIVKGARNGVYAQRRAARDAYAVAYAAYAARLWLWRWLFKKPAAPPLMLIREEQVLRRLEVAATLDMPVMVDTKELALACRLYEE